MVAYSSIMFMYFAMISLQSDSGMPLRASIAYTVLHNLWIGQASQSEPFAMASMIHAISFDVPWISIRSTHQAMQKRINVIGIQISCEELAP